MQIHVVSSLAKPIALLWKKYQKEYGDKGKFIAAAPISNTPIPMYEWITEHAHKFTHWSTFHFLMMDEQVLPAHSGLSSGSKTGRQVVHDTHGNFTYIPDNDHAGFEKKIKHI